MRGRLTGADYTGRVARTLCGGGLLQTNGTARGGVSGNFVTLGRKKGARVLRKSKAHLCEARESYGVHRRFAWWYARQCLCAAAAAFVHGLVPAWFSTSASARVKMLAAPDALRTVARG